MLKWVVAAFAASVLMIAPASAKDARTVAAMSDRAVVDLEIKLFVAGMVCTGTRRQDAYEALAKRVQKVDDKLRRDPLSFQKSIGKSAATRRTFCRQLCVDYGPNGKVAPGFWSADLCGSSEDGDQVCHRAGKTFITLGTSCSASSPWSADIERQVEGLRTTCGIPEPNLLFYGLIAAQADRSECPTRLNMGADGLMAFWVNAGENPFRAGARPGCRAVLADLIRHWEGVARDDRNTFCEVFRPIFVDLAADREFPNATISAPSR